MMMVVRSLSCGDDTRHATLRRHLSTHDSCLDRHVRVGDVVTVEEGPFARQRGTVKHVHRTTLFIHSTARQRDAGMMAAKVNAMSRT